VFFLEVRFTDSGGNTTSADIYFRLDATPPSIVAVGDFSEIVIEQESDPFVFDSADFVEGQSDYTLSIDGHDFVVGDAVGIQSVCFGPAEESVDGYSCGGDKEISIPFGVYDLKVVVKDLAGNESSLTLPLTVRAPGGVTLDAPTLSVEDDSGALATDSFSQDTTLILSGSTYALGAVEVFDQGLSIGNVIADDAGVWSFDSVALQDGLHVFIARASDADGNLSGNSDVVSVTVDSVAPSVEFDSRAILITVEGASFYFDSAVLSLGDSEYTLTIGESNIRVADDLGLASVSFGPTGSGENERSQAGDVGIEIPFGSHDVSIKAVDRAGLSIEEPFSVTVLQVPGFDVTADSGDLSSGDATRDNSLSLSGSATSGHSVEVFDGVSSLGSVDVVDGVWSLAQT